MADRTIQIIIDVNDRTGGKLNGLKESLLATDKAAQRLSNRFKSFATQKYMATIRLIDRVTEPSSKINALLKKLAGGAWRISLKVSDGALAGIRKIESALMKIAGKTYNIAVNVKDNFKGKFGNLLEGAAMGAGMFMPVAGMAGVGFGVANAIQASAGFEKQMSKVQAIRQLDKNSPEMQQLTQQAKELGMKTEWTRQQVGEAQYYQSLAGWETPQILATTPHLLSMASATDTPLQRTADIVTDLMTAYNLKPTDTYINSKGEKVNVAQEFIDTMTKLQAVSNTNVEQAYQSGKYSANQFGALSMHLTGQEQVQAAMENFRDAQVMTALMANAGIKESMAGTGMSNILQRMASGNRNALFGLGFTGTQIEDLQHNLLSEEQIMKQLNKAFHEGLDVNAVADFMEELDGIKLHADTRRQLSKLAHDVMDNGGQMGSADRVQLAKMLAGAEHSHKLLALLMGDWDAMEKKLTEVKGTAEDMANIMTDNLTGSFVRLGSAWDAFQQDLFASADGGGLRNFVDALTEIITRANKLFADGIDFGDIGAIIGDIVSRLKNKFLELDGIGSVLAGGALMTALIKLGKTAQNVMTTIKGLNKPPGANPPTSKGMSQSVGTMNVTAGVVNVNGKVGGVGGRRIGDQSIIDRYNRERERIRGGTPPPPPAPSIWSNAGSAAKYSAAFAGLFAAFDIMSVKAANAERLANATPETREQILKENRESEWMAGGGAAGSIIGAVIGAALGSAIGPLGTMLGGIIGSTIGEYLGKLLGIEGAKGEEETAKKPKSDYYEERTVGNEASEVTQKMSAGFKRTAPYDELKGIAERQALRRQADAQELASLKMAKEATEKQLKFFDAVNRKHGALSPFANEKTLNATQDFYAQQRKALSGDETRRNWQAGQDLLNDMFGGGTAEAAELNEEQRAQQAAMERGEFVPPEITEPPLPEVDTSSWFDNLMSQFSEGWANFQSSFGEMFSGLGDTLSEGLSSIGESASELLNGLMERFNEGWNSLGESASELLSNLGTTFQEGLNSIAEGAGEMFSGLGEMASAGLTALQNAASSALEGVQNLFNSARESIMSTWSELPGFFSGIFSGLGGAASAAGAAIYSGLTSVIGAVISAWQGAVATVSGIISSISAMASSISLPSFGSIPAHAEGGIITRPEVALIGERGDEAILPLYNRERSMEILNETGLLEGETAVSGAVEEKKHGGFFGKMFGSIGDVIQSGVSGLGEFVSDIAGGFGGVIGKLPSLVGDIFGNFGGLFEDLPKVFEGLEEAFSPKESEKLREEMPSSERVSTNQSEFRMEGITMNVTFNISGEAQNIVDEIQKNLHEVADTVMSQIAKAVGNVHANQNLEA